MKQNLYSFLLALTVNNCINMNLLVHTMRTC